MSTNARSTDWKTKPMPGETEQMQFHRIYTQEEFQRLSTGLIPGAMEDKWFIYCENHQLNIHRSWTGYHIYSVTFQPNEDGTCAVSRAIVNRNKEEYNYSDNNYDVSFLHYLIDRLLLGKDVALPIPSDISGESSAVYKHAMVGYAMPNKPVVINAGDRLGGCIAGGAIGDSIGSYYEGRTGIEYVITDMIHGITDDTQLTIATCESIIEYRHVSAEGIAKHLLSWYNKGKLTGLGASTLKALRDLQMGAHWALSGRSGEYAAGNGAAMRIAPIAFFVNPDKDRTLIRDVCNITHKNDEAYVGCLAVIYSIHYILTARWLPGTCLATLVAAELPDSSVRDNLMKLQEQPGMSIRESAKLVGTSGHVIESVPFAIFAAGKVKESSFENVLAEIILCGGDTDTNASIAGQIMGAEIGFSKMSMKMAEMFVRIEESHYILETVARLSGLVKQG